VPYKEVWVERGRRYRLRFVAGLCTVCGVQVSIEGHGMTLIATDGSPVVPVNIGSVDLFSGTKSWPNMSFTNCNEQYWPSPVEQLRYTSSPHCSIPWVRNKPKV
jgi:FtsP/CotA-like multicopper oxidase with cupredoxin domain